MSTSLTHLLFLDDKDCSSRGPDADFGTDRRDAASIAARGRHFTVPHGTLYPVKDWAHDLRPFPTRRDAFQGRAGERSAEKPKGSPGSGVTQPPNEITGCPLVQIVRQASAGILTRLPSECRVWSPLAPRDGLEYPASPVARAHGAHPKGRPACVCAPSGTSSGSG